MDTQPGLHLARRALLVAILDHILNRRRHPGDEQHVSDGARQPNPVKDAARTGPVRSSRVQPQARDGGPDRRHVQPDDDPNAPVEHVGVPPGEKLVRLGPDLWLQEAIVDDELGRRVDQARGAGGQRGHA